MPKHGNLTERDVSVRLASMSQLVQINSFYIKNIKNFSYKTSYLNEEVNCTKPSPSVSIPWAKDGTVGLYCKTFMEVIKSRVSLTASHFYPTAGKGMSLPFEWNSVSGSTRVGFNFYYKYKTRVEVTGTDKHCSEQNTAVKRLIVNATAYNFFLFCH